MFWVLVLLEWTAEAGSPTWYGRKEGLPQGQVTALEEDPDGFLWVGTYAGLVRFDGQQFEKWGPERGLSTGRVLDLASYEGKVYAATRQGLYFRDGERFRRIEPHPSAASSYAVSVAPSEHGLYAIQNGRLWREEAGQMQPVPAALDGGLTDVAVTRDGTVWVGGNPGVWRIAPDSKVTQLSAEPSTDVEADPLGGVWVGTRRGLFHSQGDHLVSRGTSVVARGALTSMWTSPEGVLWMSGAEGVASLDVARVERVVAQTDQLPHGAWAALVGREGNLIVGDDGNGLAIFPKPGIESYELSDRRPYAAGGFRQIGGADWIATLNRGLWRNEPGQPSVQIEGLPSIVWTVAEAGGRIWAATSDGLFEVKGDRAEVVPEVGSQGVLSLFEVDGRWFAGSDDLFALDGDRWRRIDLGQPWIFSHARAENGDLWLGVRDGLLRWDPRSEKVLLTLDSRDDLPDCSVYAVLPDEDGLLLATDVGLLRWISGSKAEFWGERAGLRGGSVNWVARAPDGRLWVGADEGVYVQESDRWRLIDEHDGLPDGETNVRAYFWRDGRLWAGTAGGWAIIDPLQIPKNLEPPRLSLEAWAGDQRLDWTRPVVLPHDGSPVRFRFHAVSIADSKGVVVRYRLVGHESAWVTATTREARYPKLPPGEYTFELIAGNDDDVWSEQRGWTFVVEPNWWERTWFRGLLGLVGLLALGGLHRVRTEWLVRQKRELEQVVADRTQALTQERERSDRLLQNILPAPIVESLKNTGRTESQTFADATILFTDFEGFTRTCAELPAEQLVHELNEIFAGFDAIARKHRLEKLKTIGDAYMAVAGVPVPNDTHPCDGVEAALEMQDWLESRNKRTARTPFGLRIGLHTGSVVAGVVGTWKFAYDIWGDAVNIAARMESAGEPGEVNVSAATWERVKDRFDGTPRGKRAVKGRGELEMFFVTRKQNSNRT